MKIDLIFLNEEEENIVKPLISTDYVPVVGDILIYESREYIVKSRAYSLDTRSMLVYVQSKLGL